MGRRRNRASALLAVVAAAAALLAPAVQAQSLPDLVERAWQLAQGPELADARTGAIDARALAGRALLAGAPTVGLSLRRDLPRWAGLPGTDDAPERGSSEIESAVSAPIWLPGQRDAQQRVLGRERALLAASLRAERLRVAGEVREAAWALAIAQVEQRLQHERARSAQLLEDDVGRRVEAGELAPSDRLLVQAERLSAQAALAEAAARVEAARVALRGLTGADRAAAIDEPVAGPADPRDHPDLAVALQACEVGRARLALAQASRRDNPTASIAARFERDTWGAGWRNSLRLGIELPLDTEARNAPRLAAAGLELAEAEAALARRQRQVAADAHRARLAMDGAGQALLLHARGHEVALEAQLALERALRAGERGLPEILRLRAQTFETMLARDLARARLGLAVARFNQAQGVTP